MLGRGKVGHGLNKAAVTVEGVFDQFLAVAGGGHAGHLQAGMVLVQFQQRFLDQRDGVAQVGAVAFKQDVGVLVDDHQLDGGGAGVDADMHRPTICAEGQAGDGGLHVAGVELLVLLLIGKQRRQAHVGGRGAVIVQPLGDLVQVQHLIGVEGRAHGHKEQAVLRQGAGNAQGLVKAPAQRFGEGQRPAQVQDVALDGAALGQARDGLVDHCLIDGRCDVTGLCALVDQRLDVAFGKHAAAAGDGVGAGSLLGRPVHLVRAHLQQGGHLVDESTRAAGAAAVHADLGAVRQEQDLGILAAQLNDAVGAGHQTVGGHAGREDLLHKGDLAAVHQAHTGRAGDRQVGFAIGQIFGGYFFQQRPAFFQNMAEMPLVCRKYDLSGVVQHNTLNRGGTNVQTNSHTDLTSCGVTCGEKGMGRRAAKRCTQQYHIKLLYDFSPRLARFL